MLVTLQQLMQLQHLDLSRDDPDESVWFQSFMESMVVLVDEEFLEDLLPCLPNLTSLDISGQIRFNLIVTQDKGCARSPWPLAPNFCRRQQENLSFS